VIGARIRPRVRERQSFVQSIASAIDGETAAAVFDTLNRIATLRYEEATNSGFLVLCPARCCRELLSLRFEEPFPFTDLLGVRKMLEISDRRLCLLSDGRHVHGFTTNGQYHPESLLVQFQPHGVWQLLRDGCLIAQIDGSENCPAASRFDESAFTETILSVFGPVSETECDRLWHLVATASRQLRGTNVLISREAAAESVRLGSQCTRIEPLPLDPALMERLTAIDGTVIIDTRGVCHAIGAILDGPVSERGDRTRGGRYNSALMYVDNSPFACLIVVVSQTGTVDLVWRHRVMADT